MTTNFMERESESQIVLPSQEQIESIYNSIESQARQQYQQQTQSSKSLSPRLLMSVLGIVGVLGILLGSSDLRVDPAVTFDTKLGQRTQPYWLVPKGAKVVKTEAGAGAVKGLGWLFGGIAGAGLAHLGGTEEKWQRFVGTIQTQWVDNFFKKNQARLELQSMAALQKDKQRLNTEVEVDLVEQRWQFNQAIGYDPILAQSMQQPLNSLPYGAPGTYDDINRPGDKVEGENVQRLPRSEPSAETKIQPLKRNHLDIEVVHLRAKKILNSLAGIKTSIFLAAPTRCGKTHTLHKWLEDLITRFPQAEIYVVSQKYEHFPGVASDRLAVFDSLKIEESMRFLDEVYKELLIRKSKPATEETYRNFPVKLILEDWFATHQCLTQNRNNAIWDDIAAKLGMIATVGGQYNVAYFICTQSFNIASSGVADSNIRLNLALLAQGLVRTSSDDEEQGSYGVIEQMINNSKVLASKETRDRIAGELRDLIHLSMEEQTPIILSTIGNPVLGLMPKIDIQNPVSDYVADATLSGDIWEESSQIEKIEPCEPNENKGYDRRNLIETYEVSKTEPKSKPSEPLQTQGLSDSDKKYIGEKYSRTDAKLMVLNSLVQRNQKNTIEMLWHCTKGSSEAYRVAKAEFDDLMSDEPKTLT